MGKKRKHEDSEENIRKKIKKLTDKLKKRRRIIVYSDSDSDVAVNNAENNKHDGPPAAGNHDTPSGLQDEQPQNVTLPDETAASSVPIVDPIDEELDKEVLELLGEAPKPEIALGKAIHADLAARWLEIIKKGLAKEVKEKLAKDYLVPGNCESLIPPILNPEAKAALTEQFVKRDASLMYRQKQISNALAALAPVVDFLISKECDQNVKLKTLKPISDACRILCDLHHNETNLRKKFIVSSISVGLKDTLVSSNTDKYLFGDNMSEKIKTAKNIQRTGEALKITQFAQKSTFNKSYNKNRTNYKALHQKQTGRLDAGKQTPAPRQQNNRPPATLPVRRTPPQLRRSPPPSPPSRRRNQRR